MPAKQWLGHLRFGSPILAVVLLVTGGVRSWNEEVRNATLEAKGRGALLASQIAGVAGAQFVLHGAIAVRIRDYGEAEVRSEGLHRFLKDVLQETPRVYGIGLVALDGTLIASSGEYPARTHVGHRAYLDLIAQGEEQVVDRRDLERNGIDALISASATTIGGQRAAIVTAWPLDETVKFVAELARQEGHSASLIRSDGAILLASGAHGVTRLPYRHPLLAEMRSRTHGETLATDIGGMGRWFVAFSPIRDAPVFAVYAISMQSVLSVWIRHNAPFAILIGAAGIFGFILFGVLRDAVDNQTRRAAAVERAEAADALARHHAALVREMNHRIKNNLSLISSIIRHDDRRHGSVRAEDVTTRIEAVASLHDMLYAADEGTSANLEKLLRVITANPAIIPPEKGILIEMDLRGDVTISSKVAVALSMIVVEVLTNAVKHAFVQQEHPVIRVRLDGTGPQHDLVICDNGPGFGADRGRRSGSELVEALASSAGISVRVETVPGVCYRLSLPAA